MALTDIAQSAAHRWLRLSKFASRFVDTEAGRLHYYEYGRYARGPTVVIQHGVAASAVMYAEVLRTLRHYDLRIIALDAPGHGRSVRSTDVLSPGAIYRGVRDAVTAIAEDHACVLFGNSLGGALMMRYALDHPGQVSGLFLSSPAGTPLTQEEFTELRGAFQAQSHRDAQDFLRRIYGRPPLYAKLLTPSVKATLGRARVAEIFDNIADDDTFSSDELAGLRVPIVLSWGQNEALLPRRHFEYYRAHLPAHTEVIEPVGFGHCPYLQAPRELARRIGEFAVSV